jgi:DNA-3-methyladenine glycosylase
VYKPLPRAFFSRDAETVARELLGKLIVRQQPGQPTGVARIVEVEAYLGLLDLASHARRGPTPRAKIMFGPPGHLYVYLIYGKSRTRANSRGPGRGPAAHRLIGPGKPTTRTASSGLTRNPCRGTGPGALARLPGRVTCSHDVRGWLGGQLLGRPRPPHR